MTVPLACVGGSAERVCRSSAVRGNSVIGIALATRSPEQSAVWFIAKGRRRRRRRILYIIRGRVSQKWYLRSPAVAAVTIKGPLVAADVTNRRPSLIKSGTLPYTTLATTRTFDRRPRRTRQKKPRTHTRARYIYIYKRALINSAFWHRWLTGWLGLLFPNYMVKLSRAPPPPPKPAASHRAMEYEPEPELGDWWTVDDNDVGRKRFF